MRNFPQLKIRSAKYWKGLQCLTQLYKCQPVCGCSTFGFFFSVISDITAFWYQQNDLIESNLLSTGMWWTGPLILVFRCRGLALEPERVSSESPTGLVVCPTSLVVQLIYCDIHHQTSCTSTQLNWVDVAEMMESPSAEMVEEGELQSAAVCQQSETQTRLNFSCRHEEGRRFVSEGIPTDFSTEAAADWQRVPVG